jgi:hypothetical protein
MAYCLLGIFGVNMSYRYGEGQEEAIQRLRRKIKKYQTPPLRPVNNLEKPSTVEKPPTSTVSIEPETMHDFWEQQFAFAEEQRKLQEHFEAHKHAQAELSRTAQEHFEGERRKQAERQRLEETQLRQLQVQQPSDRVALLEQENLAARARYVQDQLALEEYDRKVKELETVLMELQCNYQDQNALKDEQILLLQDQLNSWRNKYEALAKLYSQLRLEHFDLLKKFKGVQTKAASAQQAIDDRDRYRQERSQLKRQNQELTDQLARLNALQSSNSETQPPSVASKGFFAAVLENLSK